MAKISFDSLFTINADGTIVPRQTIRIAGVTLSPGITIQRGTVYGGVDLTMYTDRELEVTYDDGTAVITAIY